MEEVTYEPGEYLKPKERRFCEEYLRTGLKMESAKAVGYGKTDKSAANAATKLLKREDCISYLHSLQAEARRQLHIDDNWAVLKAIEVYERCMTAVPVKEWDYSEHKMVETGEYVFDSKGALKAWEIIKSLLGLGDSDKDKLNVAVTFIEDVGKNGETN